MMYSRNLMLDIFNSLLEIFSDLVFFFEKKFRFLKILSTSLKKPILTKKWFSRLPFWAFFPHSTTKLHKVFKNLKESS